MSAALALHRVSVLRCSTMFEWVTPAAMEGRHFLHGEAERHRLCRVSAEVRSVYGAFFEADGDYFEADEPMSVPEFQALTTADIAFAIQAST